MNHRTTPLALLLAFLLLGPPAPSHAEDEVQKTASGLAYVVVQAGEEGTRPEPGDVVTVHYTGTFADGREFDSSRSKGKPFTFRLGQGEVIRGWDEGVALMNVGARFRFVVPWQLAYGETGRPPRIPPKTDLHFDVELLEVTRPPAFRAGVPDAQKKTASGLVYEVCEAGEGQPPRADQGVSMRFALWTQGGELIVATETAGGAHIAGALSVLRLGRLDMPFLKEAALLMKPGMVCRFEVPGALGVQGRQIHPSLPPDATTIWELELEKVNDVPAFVAPGADRTKTASGLGYEVLKQGTGPKPGPTAQVRVQYTGWLEDGTLFDSSHARGEPIVFPLDRVVRGWTEGLQLMPVGSTYRLTIPADIAYGDSPPPGSSIPPGATLVFLIELLSIEG